jgi:hypothetical protein
VHFLKSKSNGFLIEPRSAKHTNGRHTIFCFCVDHLKVELIWVSLRRLFLQLLDALLLRMVVPVDVTSGLQYMHSPWLIDDYANQRTAPQKKKFENRPDIPFV